jgi:hypothetical protein
MSYNGEPQPNKHSRYCKKAYKRYFAEAEKKIESASAQSSDGLEISAE